MQIILLESIRKLGKLGEIVSVRSGFARNYLIPQGKATPATDKNKAHFESRRHELELKANGLLGEAQIKAEKLEGFRLVISALASEEGKLYGSVGATEIREAIVEQIQVTVERKDIRLPNGPIHALGEFEVVVQPHNEVVSKLIVVVEEKPH